MLLNREPTGSNLLRWRNILLLMATCAWLTSLPGVLLAADEDPPAGLDEEINIPDEALPAGPEADIFKQLRTNRGTRQNPGTALDQSRNRDTRQQAGQTTTARGRGTSLLEADFSLRAKSSLIQFGYNMFRQSRERTAPVVGSAPDSYVLGVGDELIVSFRGREEKTSTLRVDMEGRVMVPGLPEPLVAMGRPFGEFRNDLREKVRTTKVGTEVFVSIGAFRFFSVYVMGEVTTPGMHRVTGLSTLLDALSIAGGIRKTGTLRTVQLHRNGEVQPIDLYALLGREGNGMDPTLAAGDRIVVPPIGPVVGVSGLVKRPGIYELPSGEKKIPLNTLMELAGGPVTPQGNRYSLLKPDAQERESLVEIQTGKNSPITNGNIVLVESRSGPTLMGEVAVEGHVSRSHTRSQTSAPTVRSLLADQELLLPDPYLPFGVIYRTDPKSRNRTFLPIDLGMTIARHELDHPLTNHDILIVLSQEDIRFLSSERVAEILRKNGTRESKEQCTALSRLEAIAASSDPLRFSNLYQFNEMGAISGKGGADAPRMNTESAESLRLSSAAQLQEAPLVPDNRGVQPELNDLRMAPRLRAGMPVAAPTGREPVAIRTPQNACPAIFNKYPDLLPLLLDNSVLLEGNEDHPTLFPILPGARLADIVGVAQGVIGAARLDKNFTLEFQIDRKRGSRDATRRVMQLPAKEISSFDLQPGDVLSFKIGQVRMTGHVNREQQRTLQSVPTARHFLLDLDLLKTDPYLLFGVLRRLDPKSRNRTLAGINLEAVIQGDDSRDVKLQHMDELVILGENDILFLSNPLVQGILLGKAPRQDCASLRHLAELMSSSDAFRYSSAINLSITEFEQDKSSAKKAMDKTTSMLVTEGPGVRKIECPAIYERFPEILPYLLENATILTGEIRTPGVFPVLSGTPLSSLVQSGGGVTARADMKQVEISRSMVSKEQGKASTSRTMMDFSVKKLDEFQLAPGDVLRFSPIFSDREIGYVRLEGEFFRAGLYDIRRNDKLSDVIARAGGITNHAYPHGAIFTRTAIQKSQKEGFDRVARELEMGLANLMTSSKEKGDTASMLESARGIIVSLRAVQPLGRMVVEANPEELKTNPELDIYLEAGDRLFMPKRPSEISVSGAVLNPGSFLFVQNRTPMDYIKWAGGFKDNASKGDTFLVMPDGKAQALWSLANWWDQQSSALVPGSTIVVPLDPRPFEIMGAVKDVTQILSQWAITIASLSVLSNK
ncbi:MAG: SLBB domain-containing protein [Magnetococcales bacterium]|nr:SLBB domain-containing protein [Magnetococcales bacterium]